jgi:anti-sigma factor (TIGR02949 family)
MGITTNQEITCTDCKECLEALQIVLDGEATQKEINFVYEHIDHCSHCLDCYEVDKTLRETIQLKIEKKCVPSDLIVFIQSKILASYTVV